MSTHYKIIDLEQRSPEWHAFRATHIMASCSSVIMGVSKWMTPYQLWLDKNGLYQNKDSFSMKEGRDNEEMILALVNEKLQSDLKPTVIESTLYPFMGASLDGLSSDGKFSCEIKWANKEDHELVKKGIVPKHYYPQVQKQYLCLGPSTTHYYGSFYEKELIMLPTKFDDEYHNKMIPLEKNFYDCMINFTPPELGDKDYQISNDQRLKDEIQNIYHCREMIKKYKKSEEISRDTVISLCNNRSTLCGDTKITKTVCRGAIDYDSIAEFKNIDLEKYRKESRESWRIS